MKKIPKIRFPEFSGEWEEKKLGNIADLMQSGLSRKLEEKNIGIPVLRSNNLINGKIDIREIKYWYKNDPQGSNTENYFLKKGDILINFINSLAQIGKGAIYNNELGTEVIYTTNIMRLRINQETDGRFIYNYFNLKKYNDYIQSITKPAVNQASFTTVEFKNFLLNLPSLPEQEEIASFLSSVDSKIEKLERKKELWEQYKKGMMQKIFSQELRFQDENGEDYPEWEEKSLGEIGEIVSGLTYSPDDIVEEGILVLRSSNIRGRTLKFEDNVYVNVDKYNAVKENDILICVRNGSKQLIGKNALINKESEGLAFGAFMSVFRSPINKFIFQYFDTPDYKEKIHANLGATINSINGSDLKKFKIKLPSLPEQTLIADFLSSIDSKIEMVEKELLGMKEFKKGLLQKMFV